MTAPSALNGQSIVGAFVDVVDASVSTLTVTRLGPDLGEPPWSTVDPFHRATDRIERQLDGNKQAQRRSQSRTVRRSARSNWSVSSPKT
jgi:hypothetical protein